ncbi:tRNA preQ1(34) S-adenosylmethionine ribosyltransferase-isomerase QueA [Candidatus Saccharibacteria bacterium]|nr:MAG: tRNA preQ1(34) S-adenosylmethionine ribosyltransferase-isomerase QueA [Candidatus Saccharibacteria bacterium]
MQLSDYDYDLPESAIAIHPPKERGSSRLLVLDKQTGSIVDDVYKNLSQQLQSGDVLVLNNTKVLPARLLAKTETDEERELLLLEKHGQGSDHHTSLVMYRRKIRPGQQLHIGGSTVAVEEVFQNGTAKISSEHDLWQLAEEQGEVPLPPYMHRREEADDRERYQTVFARERGSVAAPTASLNMTPALLETIRSKGVEVVELTLHVGLGTFMPIRVDDVTKHKMHQEYFEVPVVTAQAIARAKQSGRRVIAVGTTVTRTLEYAAADIMAVAEIDRAQPIHGEADIFIYPGYEFKVVDGLLTNYHAPKSTVLMMAAAFADWEHLKAAYEHALAENYAFLSYGDSMLIIE